MVAQLEDPALEGNVRSGLLDSPVRRSIMALLREGAQGEGPASMTAAELGEQLDLHVTTVRFHVDQLVRVGLLTTDFVRGRVGRPRKVYALAPDDLVRTATDAYASLGAVLAEAWPEGHGAPSTSPREAGRAWLARHSPHASKEASPATSPGEWLGRIGCAYDLLLQWGYQPELSASGSARTTTLTLHDCPFLDMAAIRPDVVCGVHHGLIEGAMEMAGEPGVDISMRPFVGPRTCTVTITQGRHTT